MKPLPPWGMFAARYQVLNIQFGDKAAAREGAANIYSRIDTLRAKTTKIIQKEYGDVPATSAQRQQAMPAVHCPPPAR